MRRLFKNKSKFLAGICCLCLGVASLLAGAFSFVKAPAMAEEVADPWPGFYVEQGASIRYDDVVPGIRFAVYLTKAQWKELYTKGEYADDTEVVFKAEIHFANRLNQDGKTSSGYRVVDHTVTVKALNDYFEKAENVGKPFTIKPAILLSNAWKDAEGNETLKSQEELYKMYANMEFYLTGAGIFVNEKAIAQKTEKEGLVKDYTLRSVRSVAASLLAKGEVSDETQEEIAEGFIKDANGIKANIVPNDIKSYYDKYVDSGKVDVSAVEGLQVTDKTKVTIGSTKVGDRALDGTELTLSRSAATLTDGETYNVLVDNGDTIYAFKGLIAATEIFYQTNSKGENGVARLNERFALTYAGASASARRDTMLSMGKVETFVKDGVEYSMTFYDVDRGYYVLGEDIDFTGTWATRHDSKNVSVPENVAILHNDINNTIDYSGLYGFGGTFDGNGYSIKNLRFNRNITTVSGMFGALAYGAKIKDVAFVDAHPRDYDEGHRAAYILAKATGSNVTANPNGIADQKTSIAVQKSNYAYLVAKYGSTEWVVVDNCYFHVDHTMLKDSLATGGFTLSYPYNNPTDSIFQRHKFSSSSPAGQYAMGDFGVVYEGYSGYFKLSNCVLDIPEDEDTLGSYNNGGWGWIARSGYSNYLIDTLSSLENCYQIVDKASNGKILSGFRYHVISHKRDGDWATESYIWKDAETKISTGYEVYAANDFADITDGTKVYSGLDADGKWVVVEATEDNGYTEQTTIYHYAGLNRFDNYVEMSAKNNNSLAGFNSSWEKVGGAVIWKSLADATAEKTLDLTLSKKVGDTYEETTAIGVGDTIKVDAYYNGSNVTGSIALSTNNADMLTIDGNTFTVAIGGEATLRVTAGSYTAEYTVVASAINNTAVTISSNYSKVQGETDVYSMPYVLDENGNLVATDFLSLYQAYFSNNDAAVSNVYLIDASGAKNTLAGVKVNETLQYAFANAGNVKQALNIIVDGSKGYMSFADISSVTAVITDTAGFNYIPSTEESRSGYYVLGNDYNNTKRADGKFTTRQDSILGMPLGGSDQIGYSMGGFSEERYNAFMQNETTFNKYMTSNQRLQNMYNAFLGTFDGLGHTIDNMFIDSVGLLGGYRYETDGSTLKNVKLTNVRMSIYAQYTPYVDGTASVQINRSTIFATLCYAGSASYKRLEESERINVENVVVELATTAHRNYSDFYGASNGENLYWQMFRGVKHAVVNEDGTYKDENNYNYVERSQRNVHLKDVVLTYKIGPRVGENASANGGGIVFSYVNDSSVNAALQSSYAFGAFENVYIVSAPANNGKVAFVCSEYGSKTTFLGMAKNDFYSIFSEEYNANGNSGLYYYHLNLTDKGYVKDKSSNLYNYEFDSTCVNNYLTDSTNNKNITSGWGYITTTNEDGSTSTRWVYTNDVTTYGAAGSQYECASNEVFTKYENGVGGATCTVFYATPFERYNDYKAMSDAGKTQVGNFAITADGIVWSPAK